MTHNRNRMTNDRENPNSDNPPRNKRKRDTDTETTTRKKQKPSQDLSSSKTSISILLQRFKETQGHVSLIESTWKELHNLSQIENIDYLKHLINQSLKNRLATVLELRN